MAPKKRAKTEENASDDEFKLSPPPPLRRLRRGTRSRGLMEDEEDLPQKLSSNLTAPQNLKTTEKLATRKSLGMARSIEHASHRNVDRAQFLEGKAAFLQNELPSFNEPKTALQIESTPALKNLDAFNRVAKNLQVKTVRAVDNIQPQPLQELLSLKKTNDYTFSHVQQLWSTKPWTIICKSKSGGADLRVTIPTSHFTADEDVEPYGEMIATVANHYPTVFEGGKLGSSYQTATIVDIAIALVDAKAKRMRGTISYSPDKSKAKCGYKMKMHIIDPESGDVIKFAKTLRPSSIMDGHDVPVVPANFIFYNKLAKHKIDVPKEDELDIETEKQRRYAVIPDEFVGAERQKHEAAINILCLLACLWENQRISEVDFRRVSSAFIHMYSEPKFQSFGPYNGKILAAHKKGETYTSFGPKPFTKLKLSPAVLADVKGSWPDIFVRSHDNARVAPVLDMNEQTYLSQGGVKKSWKNACKTADFVNEQIVAGEPAESFCQCTLELSQSTRHPCGICLQSTICKRLQAVHDSNSSVPLCGRCREDPDAGKLPWTASKKKSVFERATNLQTRYMQAGLRQILAAEVLIAMGGKKTDDFDAVLDKLCLDTWAEIEKQLPTDDTWWDAYASITTSFSEVEALAKEEESRLVGGNPFAPSIDAAFPTAEADGKRFVHAPNNVVLTARCLNFAKFTWLPAILQVVADFLNSERDSAARLKAIKKAGSIWLTGLTTAYEKASRMWAKSTSLADLQKTFVAAEPLGTIPTVASRRWLPLGWKNKVDMESAVPECAPDILAIAEEIERKFKVKFARGKDRSPYPYEQETMPPGWSWGSGWMFFAERAVRCWMWCNGRWTHVDGPMTIWLESLYQSADKKCMTLMNLPRALFWRHPFRVVVAHLHHGQQIRTGWTKLHPKTLSDRDATLCNMVFDTQFENMLKQRFAESWYPLMLERVARVQVPVQWYDATLATGVFGQNQEVDVSPEMMADEGLDPTAAGN